MDLRTSRLRLRPFVDDDFTWLHPIASSPTVTRFTDWGPNTAQDTRSFLDDAARSGTGPEVFLWAVTLAGGTGIGSAGVTVLEGVDRRASFGYTLSPSYWGRGHATEIAQALVAFARAELDVRRVEATCHPDNVASARVLEKAGLSLQARLRDHRLVGGRRSDSLLYTDPVDPSRPSAETTT